MLKKPRLDRVKLGYGWFHLCDVTEINLRVNDRAHGGRKRPSN